MSQTSNSMLYMHYLINQSKNDPEIPNDKTEIKEVNNLFKVK